MNTQTEFPKHACNREHQPTGTILLVEDEPFVREATSLILQSAGFEVLAARDAEEARALYEQSGQSLDLLMSDLVLPGRSGRQLGSDVRCRWPGLPVLLTSGYLEADPDREASDASTFFLQKPYSKTELVAKLEMILSRSRKKAAARHAG